MGRLLDLAKSVQGVSGSVEGYEINERNERSVSDPYQTAAEESLRAVCTPDYPAEMILWLEQAAPALYRRVVVDLPDRISLAWECHVPIADFQAILNEWVETHQSACALYRASGGAGLPSLA